MFLLCCLLGLSTVSAQYMPTQENLQARKEFEGFRFGIFLHWGLYSVFGQGEWYLSDGKLKESEYAKVASCFYPHLFDAAGWVRAIKESGARYITFTSRHHEGFSMWDTAESDYNIVDATPFGRDVVKELSEACLAEGIKLYIYYSILDWRREDYPLGWTGKGMGRVQEPDYDSYFQFMKNQMRELLTQYKGISGLWFDGYWDHVQNFDWRMPEFYRYIHSINPECLIGNNHHIQPIEGEDFQMFERDLPGENKAGYSPGGYVSDHLPLEMCQTMNGMWGYKVADQDYKSADELITLLVRAAGKGSNLLLNIGPQPNGELPAMALDRLKAMGEWMKVYGETIYDTQKGDIGEQAWGVTTQKGGRQFLHVLDRGVSTLTVFLDRKPRRVVVFRSQQSLETKWDKKNHAQTITLPVHAEEPDFVVEIKE